MIESKECIYLKYQLRQGVASCDSDIGSGDKDGNSLDYSTLDETK